MFLKKLEIKGFKSFAEEMHIEFVPGVNAVVGPNGSGKSNVSDGIRWVLGEQSARSLRGAKMEDIIFAGSDTRRSLNVAEVTLVLDNEDQFLDVEYNEVSVTRKLFRSGESEYLINRQSCRRKDIVELFMDSGMGKEGFSIIGQGRVEEVLSSKPEERRAIFEEAAGVLKYKQRKIQAEKKLTETQDNLNRVEDILNELEGQVEPLKEQASMAKDYLAKKEELEEKDIALTVSEIETKHEQWTELQETVKHLDESKQKIEQKLEREENNLSAVQNKAAEIDSSISTLQDQLIATSERLEKEEGRRRLLEERGKNAGEKKEEWENRLQEMIEKMEQSKQEWDVQQEKHKQSKQHVEELEAKLKENRTKWNKYKESRSEEIESLKSEYIERLNEQAAIRNEEKYLSEQKTQLTQKYGSLNDDNDTYVKERADAQTKLNEWKTLKSQAQSDYDYEKESFKQLQQRLNKHNNEVEEKEKKLYDAYRYVDQTRSRLNVLEEMEADYSGFFQGVKEVLKARGGSLEGVIGAVAELIDVPKTYTTAVETALGGALQHVVTATEKDSRQAIQFLKSRQKGRATFLPADVIRARYLSQDIKQKVEPMDGYVTIGANAVTIDDKYKHLLDHLLGQVVFADSLEAANSMAKRCNYKVRIVTLDGNVVNPGGSMTGGAAKQQKGQLLGRQNELEELKTKYADMQEKTEKLEQQVRALKNERDETANQLEACRKRGEKTRDELERANEGMTKAEAELSRANSRLSMFDKESASLEEEQKRLDNRENVLLENKDSVTKKLASLENQISELEKVEKDRGEQLERLQEEETELKVQLATAKESASNDQEQAERLKDQYEKECSQNDKLRNDIALLDEQLSSMDGGEGNLDADIEEIRAEKQRLTDEMTQLRRDRVEGSDEAERLKGSIQQLTHERNEKQQNYHDNQIEMNRLDVELDTRLQRLQETYEISFDRAKANYQLIEEQEEARKKIKLIKMGMEEIGNVNLGAIEEYERVYERVSFLTDQRNDLLQAQTSLYEVIQEMDDEMKKRFSETFEAIRAHFQETFTELFGGGEADLYLTNPNELLNTGVDISARPPGKKRQHLSLLSGGEKALTAIALLFSIVKEKPVPFCVLDEVEAALDEANVTRFAKYLRTFSQTTQFIVISHRKATMEEADVLYGITMEESGVSRMVSVKLHETEELMESVQ
ncbi:chromosome segregation protein SMC [Salibacterium salarium]|uniref:Chromosome partition protein Smc n=1 Tax=Salibacterium salarium TaxID=284579 RepID=A0A3R9QIM8_9BACI|nr:chromosome segregation protein SMC [Salibacterium salarium]RSL31260.1 chromosome segregation protein SMC [Salibacterium salarium]